MIWYARSNSLGYELITAEREVLLEGFTVAGTYDLAAPYTQKRFARSYFPNNTLDTGDVACGMSLWRSAAQH